MAFFIFKFDFDYFDYFDYFDNDIYIMMLSFPDLG